MISAEAAPAPRRPLITLQPRQGWAALDPGEVWTYRDLLLILAGRDLKLRYKQTALGVAWVVLQPLLAAGIFSFVFGSVAGLEAPGGVPYFLFAFVGLLVWHLFSGIVTRATTSTVQNSHLVSKVYFPRLVLPLSTVLSGLVDTAVGTALLAVLLAIEGWIPGLAILLAPVVLLLIVLLALGVGLLAAALSVEYRDVNHALPVAVQFLLYASPVAYAVQEVPAAYRTLYYLNPLAGLLEAFRWSVFGVGAIEWGAVAYAAAVSLVLFVVGALVFKRMERRFADVI